jgi:hypothetical protein
MCIIKMIADDVLNGLCLIGFSPFNKKNVNKIY